MSRTKPVAAVNTVEDVNNALYQRALAEIELQKIDTPAAEKITQIQKQAEIDGKPFREEIEKIDAQILSFGELHKDEYFAESGKATKSLKRTLELTFGLIGFRKSSSIEVENEAKTIELIEIKKKKLAEKLGLINAIVRDPKIKKNSLTKFDDDTLVQFGISRKVQDTFFVETDIEAVNLDIQKTKAS